MWSRWLTPKAAKRIAAETTIQEEINGEAMFEAVKP
jgi:hypothetical protein